MNYWGFTFIGLCIGAFCCLLLLIRLDEREIEKEQERQEYLAQLMSATGSVRSGENATHLTEYRRRCK